MDNNAKVTEGSRFTVDLGSVRLPAIVEKQVETEIRGIVLRALARTDAGGVSRLGRSIFDTFPGHTLGLWLDPDVIFSRRGGPLTPQDHTLIIESIMKHPLHVLHYLHLKPGAMPPTGLQVLHAVLQVEQIDAFTKDRTKAVLEILPKLEEARTSAPKALLRAIDGLELQLTAQPVEAQLRILRDTALHGKLEHEGLDVGMDFAARILEDGASSIYSPDFGFYQTLSEGQSIIAKKGAVDVIKDADSLGAVAGGGVGVFVGGVGAGPGAAAGAVGASAGAAIAQLMRWLF